ncbi:MAG: zinc ribbon domain-containing protein [Ktedonobacteraceae bacterium]|nr:zinc ribbon domain-containing protein [Ktedonobacteraceae bacterium]
MRYCLKCGTPLQPEVTNCPRCGTVIPFAPQSVPSSVEALPPQQRQSSEASHPSVSSGQRAASPVAGYYGTYSAKMEQGAPYYSPPPSFTPPLAKRSRQGLGKGATVFLVLLAVLMMLSGVALIYYTTTTRPSQMRAQATATVQTILTAQVQATTTTRVQARATAQVQARATAIAQKQAQVLQNAYSTATGGTPALSSTLTGQDGANWSNYNAVGGGGCAFTGGALHASVFQSHTYVPCFARASNFSNFAFQVQMTILEGDGGGLVFRADDTNVKLYLLRISHDGLFGISVSRDRRTITPILDDSSAAIKTGSQTNLVTVIARNNVISIYVNKQFVDTINDTTYSAGEIGVFAYDNSKSTDVAFNDANVWTL